MTWWYSLRNEKSLQITEHYRIIHNFTKSFAGLSINPTKSNIYRSAMFASTIARHPVQSWEVPNIIPRYDYR